MVENSRCAARRIVRRPALAWCALLLLAMPASVTAAPRQDVIAPGAPGVPGYWDSGRKMGIGTAVESASKVWFTITEGVLGEVYYPTLDTPNVGSLQYAVVGPTGTQRESADTRHAIRLLDPHALGYEVTNTARDGSYRITTSYIADARRAVVLLHSRFDALRPAARGDRLYLVFRPNLNGTSLANQGTVQRIGGSSAIVVENSKGVYGSVSSALVASPALGDASIGYHGAVSDPWSELRARGRLVHLYRATGPGTLTVVAAVPLRAGHDFDLALGFGRAAGGAVAAAQAALATAYSGQQAAFVRGWHAYARTLRVPLGLPVNLVNQFYTSALTLKATEDKTYVGAMIASPTIPWGDAQQAGADRVGGYHLVWARDLYEVATALLAAGDRSTALAALRYLFERQQDASGGMPQNTWLNGEVNWTGLQMDQVAYPVILAWQLGVRDAATYRRHIAPAAHFLITMGPLTQQERWEEASGYSPSTIAAEIAALGCAADLARHNGDGRAATLFQGVADDWTRRVASWTVTHTGHLSHGPYYARIDDNMNPDDGDPLTIANGGGAYDERDIVDAGFLELVRLGIVRADDAVVRRSLAVVDRVARVLTPYGPAWYRYNHDGYGETIDGAPYTGTGGGRLWPLLTGERGEYDLAAGDHVGALAMLHTMGAFAYGAGMIPEQVWDAAPIAAVGAAGADDLAGGTPPRTIGLREGVATGSATPLDWSMAQFVRLAADLGAGHVLERPAVIAARYTEQKLAPGPALVVTAPSSSRHHVTSPLLVQGRSTPGAQVLIALYSFDGHTLTSVPVDAQGRFSYTVALGPSENKLVIVATSAAGTSTVQTRTVIKQL